MTLLVRNEEDIIRQNIEYHLAQGIDFIIARDNLSEDGTKEILMEYQKLNVLLYQFEANDTYAQYAWVTEMAQMAYIQFDADWIINADADEFWWPENGKSFKQVFLEVPQSVGGLNVQRFDFPPRPQTDCKGFLNTMIYRQLESFNYFGEPLPSKVCHRAIPDIVVAQGNHVVSAPDCEIRVNETNDIVIFHFPIRTLEQITSKIYYGGRAYERSLLPQGNGITWRKLYERLEAEGLKSYYEENLINDRRLQQALQQKILVEDRRLLNFFINKKLCTRQKMNAKIVDLESPYFRSFFKKHFQPFQLLSCTENKILKGNR